LCSTNLTAQVGLARLAELAFPAFWCVEGYDVVARLDGSDAFADGFDNACAFVAENNGEGTFGVFAGESIGI
jgi:hypothetical protein